MTGQAEWVPDGVDVDVPSAARVYDFLLGGRHNFAADRAMGEQVLRVQPDGRRIAASNRAFLRRAVRYLVDQGITQFLDLGSGIPTAGNVHEIAQQADPRCRVVYVDYDTVAVAHSRFILDGNDRAAIVNADLCQPDTVLDAPAVRRLLDFSRPVGLLTVAIFHFVSDDNSPRDLLASYREALPSGSYLALSHLTADQMPTEMDAVVTAMRHSRNPMYFRSYPEVVALFDGFELVEPGVVSAPQWRDDQADGDDQDGIYVGVARRP
ncbi:SAM-dependent methyltransferase [Planosporangium sp. 12N6]|uniref:SAM-dependent methyltransferase n=1 Tax=Planosporangium spinosum TaxID=3402278 RepID=UPI003CF10E2B